MTENRALCGWLMKQDAKSLWKGWKKRWFQQLHDYHLYYFPSCTTDVSLSKGYIDMKLILHVQVDPAQKDKNVFHIITQDRTYVLQANSPDEVEYWIAGLNSIVASLSQPLTALISKAELFEIQQQHIKDQERRGPSRTVSAYNLSMTKKDKEIEREKEKERHPRAASVRYPSLIPSDSSGEMKISRSNSLQNLAPNLQSAPNLQNITYIDNYNAETSAADASILSSSSSSSIANSEYISSSPSLSSNQQFTPPSAPFVGGSKSTPVTPIKSASASMPFLDIVANKSTREQDVEKEKQEKKKWASMKDMQALILREKEAEIARLVIEVARVNEMHEKAIESQKVIRQEVLMQLEQHRMEDAQKILEIETKYNKQIEDLNNIIKNKDKEIELLKENGEELKQKREDAIEYLEKMKIDTDNKISILEKEIKLKENLITQLNNNLTSVNGEVAKKDTLLKDTVRGITYPHAFEDTRRLTVAQLEKERETRYAFQEQCAFLGQELFKLETELKQHKILIEEQKNKILERNTSSLASSPKNRLSSFSNFSSPSRSSSSSSVTSAGADVPSLDLDNSQINILLVENESLRQKYFMSVGRSLKLQTTLNGGFSNISITDLYDEAIRQKLNIEAWPNFISAHLAGLAPPLVFT